MGGKQKQANRTKNNTRPSSSSRSAEKLGANVPGFVGFSASQDGGYIAVLPGFSSNDNFDMNIDPNLQLIFRKMSKKDPVTKLKALNEFITYINFSDEDSVISTLSFWPRLYCQLSVDCNHRVREQAQIAHGAIVGKCGRNIAPYLKQLLPVWITSQYDTYLPAKSQAKEAFDIAFPKTKLSEVLSFCRKEIFTYLTDNLTTHTSTTFSNPKLFTTEECDSIFERMIISTLQAYEFLLNNLSEEHLEWLCESQSVILNNKKFWNLANDKVPLIRSSFYAVIGCLTRRMNKWFEPKYGKKAVCLLFEKLGEKDSEVVVSVVENCILLMAYIPNWWTFVNVQNKVLPSIYIILSEGGWNNATRIGPLIVPLLVHLINVPDKDNNKFYEDYFDSICRGLEQRSVVTSKTGYEAWLSGLVECLEYIANSKIDATDEVEKSNTTTTLSKVIRLWFTTIIRPKISNSPFNYVKLNIIYVSKISMSWTKISLSDGPSSVIFSQLIRIFWKNLHFLITMQIDAMSIEEDEIKKTTDVHVELLKGLKINNTLKIKKSTRVTFNATENGDESSASNDDGKNQDSKIESSSVEANFQRALSNVVCDVCGEYINYAMKHNVSSPILNPLYSLVREFNSKILHESMLSALNKESKCLKNLYLDYYGVWLKGDTMRSPIVVDLIFSLLMFLNNEDQLVVLKSFDQLPVPIMTWCISRCISHPYSQVPAICEWLQTNTVHEALIAISKVVVKEGNKHHLELLKMCFMQADNGCLLISKDCCAEIVKIFIRSLDNMDSDHLNMCALFASYLLSVNNFIVNDDYEIYVNLSLGLFSLDCNSQEMQDILPQDTLEEINSSWQDALSTLPLVNLLNFVERASNVIQNKLNKSNKIVLHLKTIDSLVELSFNLISSCVNIKESIEEKEDMFCKVVFNLLKNKSSNFLTNLQKLELFSFISDVLHGKFLNGVPSDCRMFKDLLEMCLSGSLKEALKEIELILALSWVLFSVKIIEKLVHEFHPDNKDENDMNKLSLETIDLNTSSEIKEALSELLHTITILKTLKTEYKMIKCYEILSMFYDPIAVSTVNIFKYVSDHNYQVIIKDLEIRSKENGLYWTVCLYMCNNVYRETSIDVNSQLSKLVNDLYLNYEMSEKATALFDMDSSYKIQILNNERMIDECDELNMKSMSLAALRCICLTQNVFQEGSKIVFTKEDFKKCILSPVSAMTVIIDSYYSYKELLLYDIDISKCEWDAIDCNCAIIRFMISLVDNIGWLLQSVVWDFVMISLSSFVQSFDKSKDDWKSFRVSTLGCATFDLFKSVNKFIRNIIPESVRRQPTDAVLQVHDEWRELFSPVINNHIVNIFMKICSDCIITHEEFSPSDICLVNNLNEVMQIFDWKYLENNDNVNHNVISILKICLDTMASPCHHVLKYAANIALKSLTPTLINNDKTESNKMNAEECEVPIPHSEIVLSLHTIQPIVTHIQSCMEIALAPYKIGEDHCVLLPYSDSHSLALGYLLLWEVLLDIAQETTAYLQHEYFEIFKEGQFVDQLLSVLFRLLPEELAELSASTGASSYFKNSPNISFKEPISWELISWLACQRLIRCLQGGWLSALVRGWWGSLPTRSAHYVEQIVKTHISPLLIVEQLSLVTKKQMNISNIEVRVHSSVNEIDCIYVIEDLKMGLTVQLCPNHPLTKPLVISSGSPLNNMAWLSMYLSHQNSSVYQAIRMWANAVQKKVESTPVCYVCYSRLHSNNGQLPKMLCQTCKNKFHSTCLYKWFTTSGKATCPMCRNVFNL